MPELPEVQTVVDDLKAALPVNAVITDIKIYWPKTVTDFAPEIFRKTLSGRKILDIKRRAKYIVIDLDQSLHLIVHLRMTGHLLMADKTRERNKHEHVILELNGDRELRFHDTRKFGRFYLTDDLAAFFAHVGPEPLGREFSPEILAALLHGKSRKLKPLLLDQSVLAGLGNIYVDEALWEARLHPETKARDVEVNAVRDLYFAIVKVLQSGLDNMGTTLGTSAANYYSVSGRTGRNSDNLKVFRRQGQPCPACGTAIEKLTVTQRGTHICPKCQRLTT